MMMPPQLDLPQLNRDITLGWIERLSRAVSISGDEGEVRDIVKGICHEKDLEARSDPLGNLIVSAGKVEEGSPVVMVAAHMDEVGFMITDITEDGLLRFDTVGGINPSYLLGKPVVVGPEGHPGVIGAKPIHLTEADERKNKPDVKSLRIDIGVDSKDRAKEYVKAGDPAAFLPWFQEREGRITAKALDDRLGVAALLCLLAAPPPGIRLVGAFTVQEEIGLRGAKVASYSVNPAAAVVLDCTPAYDEFTCEGEENPSYNARIGRGPAIYLADSRTLSHPKLVEHFLAAAREADLPYQIRQPGGGGTDAGAIHLSRAGIPTLSISTPARHLHTPMSMAELTDWEGLVRLVFTALSEFDPRSLSLEG